MPRAFQSPAHKCLAQNNKSRHVSRATKDANDARRLVGTPAFCQMVKNEYEAR
jgi:hypothetical protein